MRDKGNRKSVCERLSVIRKNGGYSGQGKPINFSKYNHNMFVNMFKRFINIKKEVSDKKLFTFS